MRKRQLDEDLFKHLSQLLPAGSHLMVVYTNHKETHKALQMGVPPPATYIGFLLWKSGCTWFKDWYFPEGGWEGRFKLQGNKPPHEEAREKQILNVKGDLEAFLKREKRTSKLFKKAKKRTKNVLNSVKTEE